MTGGDALIPAALRREPAAAVPGARTTELATGHLPFLEKPNQWLETMASFLRRQNRS